MALEIEAQPVPIRRDADGTFRVGKTRVLLEIVIDAFKNGRTAEEIVTSYDTLKLEEVYGVIAYYLTHRGEIDDYLADQERKGMDLKGQMEERKDYQVFRQRLRERSQAYKQSLD